MTWVGVGTTRAGAGMTRVGAGMTRAGVGMTGARSVGIRGWYTGGVSYPMVGLLGVGVRLWPARLALGRRDFGERRGPDGRMFEGVRYASREGGV